MENDDNGAQETQGASELSQCSQSLVEKIGPKDRTMFCLAAVRKPVVDLLTRSTR